MTDQVIGTVTVNPSIDQHILIDQLTKDDAIRARDIRRDPGGKGINVSRVIRELGGQTVAFTVAGGCAGYMLKNLMAEQGIAFESVEVPDETRINVIITDRSDRTQTRISMSGPQLQLNDVESLAKKLLAYRPFPRWWVLGGSLPPGMPEDFYARLMTALQQCGATCLLDADGEALAFGLQAQPFLIKPNEYELARLAGRALPDEASLLQAAREIVVRGISMVAVTLGSRGALVVTTERAFRAVTPQVEVRSRVGAGDSFLAGYVLALSQGRLLEDAMRLGMAAGTAAVMYEGTTLCRRADVEQLLPRIGIEPVDQTTTPPTTRRGPLARDVVCGMEVDPALVDFAATYQDRKYHFCSLKCRQEFLHDPNRFRNRATGDATALR